MSANLASKLEQTTPRTSRLAPDDANRVSAQASPPAPAHEPVIDENLLISCNLSLSGKRYHDRMLRIVSSNMPGKVAGSVSAIMRKSLLHYLEALVAEHSRYLDDADLREFNMLLEYAKQHDE